MTKSEKTIQAEDRFYPPFFRRLPLSIERGEGSYVFDEEGKRYLDFTSGWGVTCLGHASPVITGALKEQAGKIIQNPNSGATYSPVRAKLMELLVPLLPRGLERIFFQSSGAEANDAAIKLARKASGRPTVVSTLMSFHGRTISTASATGQASHRDRYDPLMPHYVFVPYNDLPSLERAMGDDVAAVIMEPIQGEGGIIVPSDGYLEGVSELCRKHGAYLIIDEIQTGFFRTGPVFACGPSGIPVDFLTMAKGIAGGFPFAAFAMSGEISSRLGPGDHGGTYCGNPLGCAVSYAVVRHLLDTGIEHNVKKLGDHALSEMERWREEFTGLIREVRGRGLLLAMEMTDADSARDLQLNCLDKGLIINLTQGNVARFFPALNITMEDLSLGMNIIRNCLGG